MIKIKKSTTRRIETIMYGIVITFLFIGMLSICSYVNTHYTRHAIVGSTHNNITTLTDNTGRKWLYKDCVYKKGVHVKMIMDTNLTDNIVEDDIIVKIKLDK